MRTTRSTPLVTAMMESTVAELCAEFDGVFSHETIVRFLDESFDAFCDRETVGPNFQGLVIRRFAKERLHALAQAEGLIVKTVPEVLFVCEHNAGRSQMAAALTDHLAEGRVGVRSAGSQPGREVYPVVREALSEIGVDVNQEFPKPLTDEVVRAADAVITMGCGDACPVFPGKRYENWELTDPSGQPLETVREIRDEIQTHVEELLARLLDAEQPQDLIAVEPGSNAAAVAPPAPAPERRSRWTRGLHRSR